MAHAAVAALGEAVDCRGPRPAHTGHAVTCRLASDRTQVDITDCMFEYTVTLYKEAQAAHAAENKAPQTDGMVMIYNLLACFWIVIKCVGVRSRSPNRALLCQAAGAGDPDRLCAHELSILEVLRWRVPCVLQGA